MKQQDLLPLLPEPLEPVKCKVPDGTSVMKRSSSEGGLSGRKRTLSPHAQSRSTYVIDKKVLISFSLFVVFGDVRPGSSYITAYDYSLCCVII